MDVAPACRNCGAVLKPEFVDLHKEYHAQLASLITKIGEAMGKTADALENHELRIAALEGNSP